MKNCLSLSVPSKATRRLTRNKKKVCLITPNHISTNPRLVKEGIALEKHGFAVHLIFTLSDPGGNDLDWAILNQHPNWTYDVLEWSGRGVSSSLSRFKSGLMKKLAEFYSAKTGAATFTALVVNRNYYWQRKKALKVNADLYIAHNLGALPVARDAAKKRRAKYGFDAEDFHRNEVSNNPQDKDVIIKATIEGRNIAGADHFTAASPLIGAAYQELFPGLQPKVILNVFPKVDQQIKGSVECSKHTKLFWFSQTIGGQRGIETIILAMGLSKTKEFELHLLGNLVNGYRQQLELLASDHGVANQVFFYSPVPEIEIFRLAAKCDIGMASEVGVPHNRDICLTNKIFTYVQSGLAVLASDTIAQVQFMKRYPGVGRIYKREDAQSLAKELDYFREHKDELYRSKEENFRLGQTELNWETEQKKFIHSIENLLV